MKNSSPDRYAEISSFEDLRAEKEQLLFRSKLIETRINLTYLQVSRVFSFSNLFVSLSKEVILPKISELLGYLIRKVGKGQNSESGSNT